MKILKLWGFLVVLCYSFNASADHLAGGYFEYSYLGNNTYQIDYYFLRDCSGVTAEDPELFLTNDCGESCIELGFMSQIGNSEVVDYGCNNTCLFGDRPGYRLLHFRKNVTLWYACDSWTISTSIGARNFVDYASGGMAFYYNYCKINNNVVNNSPDIVGEPLLIGCTGIGIESLYTVTQTDGDQLVYDFVPSMITANFGNDPCAYEAVVYDSGLNFAQTFPSTAPFDLNNSNGSFEFTPTIIGTSYFAVRVREFRNGVQIGESIVDGTIYIDVCESSGETTFHSFQSSGNNTMTVPPGTGVHCNTVRLTSDQTIENVWVEGPPYLTYDVVPVSAEEVNVTICVDFPDEVQSVCEGQTVGFVIKTISGEADDCLAEAVGYPDAGYYNVYRQPGQYCPENLFFTNRNPSSGIPMPAYAHAEDRIWVGDSMPAIAPLAVQLDEGPVEVYQDLVLEAGIEIIIPSCKSGPCVTISGNQTLIISPFSCSADCQQEELEFTVKNFFKCGHEQLQAEVTSGDGPFMYKWIIEGDTITTPNSYLSIHDYVSDDSTGLIPYSCEVFDPNGNSGFFTDAVLGTKSFYKNIVDHHTIYFQYDNNDLWETGNYYAGQPGVDYLRPFFIADSVNSFAPWYGATEIECTVWDAGGNGQDPIYYYHRNLQNGNDWSFDNGEIWWNGKFPGTNYCVGGAGDVFNYVLTARNCNTQVHQEISALLILACYDGSWSPTEAKSMMDVDYYQDLTGETRFMTHPYTATASENSEIICFPNPADNRAFIRSNREAMSEIVVIDAAGKEVLRTQERGTETQLETRDLGSGVYTIIVTTTDGAEKRLKLVKK